MFDKLQYIKFIQTAYRVTTVILNEQKWPNFK